MRVLVGCEVSGRVSYEFRKLGHEAWSCDILDSRGDKDWHIKGDVYEAIRIFQWDLIILHPPCDKMSFAGNWLYSQGKEKYGERLQAIEWTVNLWELAKSRAKAVAMENPKSALLHDERLPKPYWVHPYNFGDGWSKCTGLWLYNLPPLINTLIAYDREDITSKIGVRDRKYRRSLTPLGIARAMANQWGTLNL